MGDFLGTFLLYLPTEHPRLASEYYLGLLRLMYRCDVTQIVLQLLNCGLS
jgi:hypothetical protein